MGALTERKLRTNLLRWFINQDPVVVDITRPITSTSSSGGVVRTGTLVIEDQKFYFVPMKRRLTEEDNYNPQSFGEDRTQLVDYIFTYIKEDSNIAEGDYITSIDGPLDDGDYRVMFVSHRHWDRSQAGILKR